MRWCAEVNRQQMLSRAQPENWAKRANRSLTLLLIFFGALDEHRTPQVNPTTLAKVVQRKTPELIPLFERQVRRLICGATTNSGWK